MSKNTGITIAVSIFIFVGTVACSLTNIIGSGLNSAVDPTKVALEILATQNAAVQQPQIDPTKVVLEMQATAAAEAATQNAVAEQQKILEATQQSLSQTQQALIPSISATPEANTDVVIVATPTVDMTDKIKNAKILVYEDTQDIGLWISDALNGMDVTYVHVGDGIGRFMENLNSPVKWDLIIVGAESRSSVEGEFWDVINEKVTKDNTALIAEVWYLEKSGAGRIRNLMTNCGIQFQNDWPLAESIYWLEPEHPLFLAPNTAMPLIHYSRYWPASAGDLVRLSPGSKASLVAGAFQQHKSDYGLISVCMDGRMVFQTFSNHDFHHEDILPLWQNYITYTLTNHFLAVP